MLEYPPQVGSAVRDWVRSVYCGHIVALYGRSQEARREALQKALQKLQQDFESLEAWMRGSADPSTMSLRIPRWGFKGIQYNAFRVFHMPRLAYDPAARSFVTPQKDQGLLPIFDIAVPGGRVAPPWRGDAKDPQRIEALLGYLREQVQEAEHSLRVSLQYDDATTPEDVEIAEEARRHLQGSPKAVKTRVTKAFPLNLTGWKYLPRLPQRPGLPAPAQYWPSVEVQVILNFVPHVQRAGQWRPLKWELEVDVPSVLPLYVQDLKETLAILDQTVEHELRHMAQTILQQALGKASAGMPARLPPGMNQHGWVGDQQVAHAIRPVEFYSRLGDEVSSFLREHETIDRWIASREFFQELRKVRPADYRKAVGIFTQQVQAQGRRAMILRVASFRPAAQARVLYRGVSPGVSYKGFNWNASSYLTDSLETAAIYGRLGTTHRVTVPNVVTILAEDPRVRQIEQSSDPKQAALSLGIGAVWNPSGNWVGKAHPHEFILFSDVPVRLLPLTKAEQLQADRVKSLLKSARYQNKKTVKTKDGEDQVVYEYSDRQISQRHREKAERLEAFDKHLTKLRAKVRQDLKSKDPQVRGLALAVALVDHTYERIGNPESAAEGHFGVTGWQVKHLKFEKGSAVLTYVGKSGVSHRKEIGIGWLVEALRDAVKDRKPSDPVVHVEGDPVAAAKVNQYLEDFEITAKDLRGFHANTLMRQELTKARKGALPKDSKEKAKQLKEEFQTALDTVAKLVGHESATLRNQYLVPRLEDRFLKDGTVMDGFVE